MKNSNFNLVEDMGIIARDEKGNTKRLVLAGWYGKPPVYEIRAFGHDGAPLKRCGLTPQEFESLIDLLNK